MSKIHGISAMYSASAVDNDTEFCFFLNHAIMLFTRKKHPPLVLFRSSTLPSQSASQYPAIFPFDPFE